MWMRQWKKVSKTFLYPTISLCMEVLVIEWKGMCSQNYVGDFCLQCRGFAMWIYRNLWTFNTNKWFVELVTEVCAMFSHICFCYFFEKNKWSNKDYVQ